MWERGDKTNQGIAELNASSIGMAKVGWGTRGLAEVRLIISKIMIRSLMSNIIIGLLLV